jgi:isoquinoline 1-oxidoreductase alpha subunit
MTVSLQVNGQTREVDADLMTPLLWVLRDDLGLTGTKFGCGVAQCGACTVHLDGQAARACSTPVGMASTKQITTIEGLSSKAGKAVQAAWVAHDVVQCGYCQSGQIMQATALLSVTPKPTDRDIDESMNGNLCRCATYQRIRAAIHTAADTLARTA